MVGLEIVVVGTIALGLGALVAYFIYKKTGLIDKITKAEGRKREVLNDPELLLEKLNENGKIIDSGEEMEYKIVEKDGKKSLELTRKEYKGKPKKQTEPEKGKAVAPKKGKNAGGKKGATKKG